MRVNKGPRYLLIIKANVTTPEIKLTSDLISFGRVICGQRMTTFIRFENEKEVDCAWHLVQKRPEDTKGDPSYNKFEMSPTSGVLVPGEKRTIKFTFNPT